MFGSHKRQGSQVGLAVRNSLASVSIDTSVYEFGAGFRPSKEFILEPYVLGVFVGLSNLFRVKMFKGKDWNSGKKGEYIIYALDAFQNGTNFLRSEEFVGALNRLRYDPSFELGSRHAELNFGAMFGLIPNSYSDPIVEAAREMAPNLGGLSKDITALGITEKADPNFGFKYAIALLTLKVELERRFPII